MLLPRHKTEKLDKIRDKLASQLKEKLDDEDERLEKATREKEENYIKEEKKKEGKLKQGLYEQAQHRMQQVGSYS